MMDVNAALERIAPIVEANLNAYEREHAVGKCWDESLKALKTTPLVWKQIVEPNRIICSKGNRGGLGIVSSKAIGLAAAHVKSGYSFAKACDGAVAATVPTKHRELEDILSWSMKMDKAQDAPEFVMPRGQSLGSGHGN
jgi:hypothetical protein